MTRSAEVPNRCFWYPFGSVFDGFSLIHLISDPVRISSRSLFCSSQRAQTSPKQLSFTLQSPLVGRFRLVGAPRVYLLKTCFLQPAQDGKATIVDTSLDPVTFSLRARFFQFRLSRTSGATIFKTFSVVVRSLCQARFGIKFREFTSSVARSAYSPPRVCSSLFGFKFD